MATRRKKTSDEDAIEGIPQLEDDEQIVVETSNKRTIRKERAPRLDPDPKEIIDVDDDENDDDEFLNLEDESPAYSESSIAALIFSDDGDERQLQNQFCTVAIRRNPDGMNDRFSIPCNSVMRLPRLQNVEITADQADIEDRVRAEYGGGHYFFQIHYANRLASSWKSTLADLPAAAAADKLLASAAIPSPDPATPAANPFDQFLDALAKQKQMKDLLFGDEQKRMESEIKTLREQLEARREQQPASQSDLSLLLSAIKDNNNPTVIEFARDYLFRDEGEGKFGVWDFAKMVWENKHELAPVVSMLFGGSLPGQQQRPAGIESILAAAPPSPSPASLPPVESVGSGFRRKEIAPDLKAEPAQKKKAAEPGKVKE